MNENAPARRAEDKRADGAVDWTDAPRFTALGIAETWRVTVEAEGQRVVSISDQHYTSLDGGQLGQFFPTIRSCAQHLLGFIGAAPVSHKAGGAKGGITKEAFEEIAQGWDGCRYDDAMIDDIGAALRRDFERLATTAGEQAEPAQVDALAAVRILRDAINKEIDPSWECNSYHPALDAALKATEHFTQAAPAAPEQVPAIGRLLGEFSALPVLWGLNEPGALIRHSDVFKMLVNAGKTYLAAPSTAQVQAEPLTVKVERNRVWIVRGNQSFMLGYLAVEGDDPAEIHAYADNLRAALSGFTPDVKIAAPIAAAPAAPEEQTNKETK